MALVPSNPRDRNLLLVGILAVGLAVVYEQLYWAPKNDELNIVEFRLDTLDSLNRIAKAEVAKGSATKMKLEGDAFARELSVLRRLVPTENEVVLEFTDTLAESGGKILTLLGVVALIGVGVWERRSSPAD